MHSVEPMFESAVQEQLEKTRGIMTLFALMGDTSEIRFSQPPKGHRTRTRRELLLREKELLGFFLTGHPMEEYQHILGRLSCVSLDQTESMDHDELFRTALIVESVQLRVSSKTQKKFAILMVSDGIERCELPIWTEMYEEKLQLLKENQLLYAILQVNKQEETTRFSCRWMDDLTQANDQMILVCDQMFDRMKHQLLRSEKNRNKGVRKKEEVMKTDNHSALVVLKMSMQTDQLRLSHILRIKELFGKHRGGTPIEISFQSAEKEIALLKIGPQWGVKVSEQLEQELSALGLTVAK